MPFYGPASYVILCLCLQQAEGPGTKGDGDHARASHLQAHAVMLSDQSEMSCPGSFGSGTGQMLERRTCSIPEEHEVSRLQLGQLSHMHCRH